MNEEVDRILENIEMTNDNDFGEFEVSQKTLAEAKQAINNLIREAKIEEIKYLVKEHSSSPLKDDAWLEVTHDLLRDRIAALKAEEK